MWTCIIHYFHTDDNESICSDGSWVITPSPRFRIRSAPPDTHSSLENLLIEHPTMSIYSQQPNSPLIVINDDDANSPDKQDHTPTDLQNIVSTQAIRAEQTRRIQLATQLGIPLQKQRLPVCKPCPKPTRRTMRRQNQTYFRVMRGKKAYKIQHCGVKAGQRRC